MRRALKIKAFVFFLAWIIIFAHSIVPHNHHEADGAVCQNLVHTHSSDDNQTDNILRIENLPCAENVCHLKGFEYFQLNTDNLFLLSDKASQAYTCEIPYPDKFSGVC
ncbi:MAG: hypothetical protein MZV63_24220 [Marinilabiliales bacterium]|nr:hypothetical protein [Marinilabiliales bacterium]